MDSFVGDVSVEIEGEVEVGEVVVFVMGFVFDL